MPPRWGFLGTGARGDTTGHKGWLLYGANGYTGELVAREAARRGLSPILAGRHRAAVDALAGELGFEARGFDLEDPREVDRGLAGVSAVLSCAGPFARTAPPLVDACLRVRCHYLDVTGEIAVFESLAGRGEAARRAGVMLLPGAGFDVVPSDCLAGLLASRLPGATHLALAFRASGGISRGTAITLIENLGRGGAVRMDGAIRRVPAAWRRRRIDFGRGPRPAVTIPWGDVSTAFHSTGIPNVEVYLALPRSAQTALLLSRPLEPLLRLSVLQGWLKRWVRRGAPGPGDEQRARGWAVLWGEVRDAEGSRAASRMHTPESYALTTLAAVALVERALRGDAPPGFQTPARAYGARLALELPGVSLEL